MYPRRNLLSVTSALDKAMFNSFKSECEFVKNGIVKICGIRAGQLSKMVIRVRQPETSCISAVNIAARDTLYTWHEKLGHVAKLLKECEIDFIKDDQFCGTCMEGKQHRSNFVERQQHVTELGEIIHADLCSPMECASLGRSKYFLCFTCNFSRIRMVYFLREKSKTVEN